MTPERLAEIHAARADGKLCSDDTVGELLDYVDYLKGNLRSAAECIDAYVTACARGNAEIERLKREVADLAPYAEAGKQAAAEAAKREYYNGRCDDCGCCTTAQCAEGRCPENAVGESTCPCTCY